MTSMTNRKISGWLRQTRYRNNRAGRDLDAEYITIEDVLRILKRRQNLCGYCDSNLAVALDCPFLLKDNAPFVPANLLPICEQCRSIKGHFDLIWMFSNNFLSSDKYLKIIKELLDMKGGEFVREYIKKITGM